LKIIQTPYHISFIPRLLCSWVLLLYFPLLVVENILDIYGKLLLFSCSWPLAIHSSLVFFNIGKRNHHLDGVILGCILVYVYFSKRSFVHNTFQALLFSFTVWKVDRWNIFFNWRKLSLSFHGSVFETIYFLEVIKKKFNYLLIISNLIINHLTIIYFVLNFYFYFVFDTCNEIFNISCKKCKISSIKINQ